MKPLDLLRVVLLSIVLWGVILFAVVRVVHADSESALDAMQDCLATQLAADFYWHLQGVEDETLVPGWTEADMTYQEGVMFLENGDWWGAESTFQESMCQFDDLYPF